MKIKNKSSVDIDLGVFIRAIITKGQGAPVENVQIQRVDPLPSTETGAGIVTVEFTYDLDVGEVKAQ